MIPIAKPYIGPEEKQAVLAVLESGYLVQGKYVAELESQFAAVSEVQHAIATSSGTSALHVALVASGIGSGDEVITSAFTFIASVNSILFTGAKPVFADIDPLTFNLDPEAVMEAITPRTKAIMPVHLFGQACNMSELQDIAHKNNLVIIEDACQSIGASYKSKKVGSFGVGCFSLYATKNVMSAEGGMITTDDESIAEKCKLLRQHGMQRRYHHEMLGYNYRMTDLHAALGVAQMGRLAEFIQCRQRNATYLNEHLQSVIVPTVSPECNHVWHQYTVRVKAGCDRDESVARLHANGVGTGVFYPIPAHQQPHIYDIVGPVSLPVTEMIAQQVISLPVHPHLSQLDLDKIVTEVNQLWTN